MQFVCLIVVILLVTVRVTAVPKAERSIIIVFQGTLSGILVDVFYDPSLKYCAIREGTTSESEVGTPVKKQGRTGHTLDSELSSPVKQYVSRSIWYNKVIILSLV